MHSPGHRANILDPRLNEIGVGLVRHGGYLWAVEDFSANVAVLGSSQIEKTIGQLLSERGIESAGDVAAARETCAMDHGAAGGFAAEIYYALGSRRFKQAARCAGTEDQYRTLPHRGSRLMQ
jgi:hypothetical protein